MIFYDTNDIKWCKACKGVQGSLIATDQIECCGEYSCAEIGETIQGFYVAASATDAAKDNDFIIRDKGYFCGSYSANGSTVTSLTCEENIPCDES